MEEIIKMQKQILLVQVINLSVIVANLLIMLKR